MNNIDISNKIIKEFINQTNCISIDGDFSKILNNLIKKEIKKQEKKQINDYINLIKIASKNDGYDQNGILIETKKVYNIINESVLDKKNIIKMIDDFIKKTNLISYDGEYYFKLLNNIEENLNKKFISDKELILKKIKSLDKYDKYGMLVQTSLVINSIDIKNKNKNKYN